MFKGFSLSLSLFVSSFVSMFFDDVCLSVPYLFLFIGLINVGPEFQVDFVDFKAGPTGCIIATIVVMS